MNGSPFGATTFFLKVYTMAKADHYIADIKKSWKENWPQNQNAGTLEGGYEEERESERRFNRGENEA
jgi:hypothetical protein